MPQIRSARVRGEVLEASQAWRRNANIELPMTVVSKTATVWFLTEMRCDEDPTNTSLPSQCDARDLVAGVLGEEKLTTTDLVNDVMTIIAAPSEVTVTRGTLGMTDTTIDDDAEVWCRLFL